MYYLQALHQQKQGKKKLKKHRGNDTLEKESNTSQTVGFLDLLRKSETPNTDNEYYQLIEMTNSVCRFTLAACAKEFGQAELTELNLALKLVAQAIKSLLSFIKPYASKFPGEISKVILLTAKSMQEHIKSMIMAVKGLNEGTEKNGAQLVDATKSYASAAYSFFMICKTASRENETYRAAIDVKQYTKNLLEAVEKSSNNEEGSAFVYAAADSLEHSSMKLAALLNSKISTSKYKPLHVQLMELLQTVQTSYKSLCEQAKNATSNALSPDMKECSGNLTSIDDKISQILEGFIPKESGDENISDGLFTSTLGVLEKINQILNSGSTSQMKEFAKYMETLSKSLSAMKGYTRSISENRGSWMLECVNISDNLNQLKSMVDGLKETCPEQALSAALSSYASSILCYRMEIQMACVAKVFELVLEGQENLDFITSMKDLVYTTEPFVNHFKDAVDLSQLVNLGGGDEM